MSDSAPASGEHGLIQIDPKGDLVFDVQGFEDTARLQVSSNVLSNASMAFAGIYEEKLAEGIMTQEGGGSANNTITLREEPDIVTPVFSVLHKRTEWVPENLDFPRLQRLALFCDKYECGAAIADWTAKLFDNLDFLSIPEGLLAPVIVAYELDCPHAFRKASEFAILYHEGPMDTGFKLSGFDMVPDFLLEKLEFYRADITSTIKNLLTSLVELINSLDTGVEPTKLVEELYRLDLLPLSHVPETSLYMLSQRVPLFQEVIEQSGLPGTSKIEQDIKGIVEEMERYHLQSITGLCLECVRVDEDCMSPRHERFSM